MKNARALLLIVLTGYLFQPISGMDPKQERLARIRGARARIQQIILEDQQRLGGNVPQAPMVVPQPIESRSKEQQAKDETVDRIFEYFKSHEKREPLGGIEGSMGEGLEIEAQLKNVPSEIRSQLKTLDAFLKRKKVLLVSTKKYLIIEAIMGIDNTERMDETIEKTIQAALDFFKAETTSIEKKKEIAVNFLPSLVDGYSRSDEALEKLNSIFLTLKKSPKFDLDNFTNILCFQVAHFSTLSKTNRTLLTFQIMKLNNASLIGKAISYSNSMQEDDKSEFIRLILKETEIFLKTNQVFLKKGLPENLREDALNNLSIMQTVAAYAIDNLKNLDKSVHAFVADLIFHLFAATKKELALKKFAALDNETPNKELIFNHLFPSKVKQSTTKGTDFIDILTPTIRYFQAVNLQLSPWEEARDEDAVFKRLEHLNEAEKKNYIMKILNYAKNSALGVDQNIDHNKITPKMLVFFHKLEARFQKLFQEEFDALTKQSDQNYPIFYQIVLFKMLNQKYVDKTVKEDDLKRLISSSNLLGSYDEKNKTKMKENFLLNALKFLSGKKTDLPDDDIQRWTVQYYKMLRSEMPQVEKSLLETEDSAKQMFTRTLEDEFSSSAAALLSKQFGEYKLIKRASLLPDFAVPKVVQLAFQVFSGGSEKEQKEIVVNFFNELVNIEFEVFEQKFKEMTASETFQVITSEILRLQVRNFAELSRHNKLLIASRIFSLKNAHLITTVLAESDYMTIPKTYNVTIEKVKEDFTFVICQTLIDAEKSINTEIQSLVLTWIIKNLSYLSPKHHESIKERLLKFPLNLIGFYDLPSETKNKDILFKMLEPKILSSFWQPLINAFIAVIDSKKTLKDVLELRLSMVSKSLKLADPFNFEFNLDAKTVLFINSQFFDSQKDSFYTENLELLMNGELWQLNNKRMQFKSLFVFAVQKDPRLLEKLEKNNGAPDQFYAEYEEEKTLEALPEEVMVPLKKYLLLTAFSSIGIECIYLSTLITSKPEFSILPDWQKTKTFYEVKSATEEREKKLKKEFEGKAHKGEKFERFKEKFEELSEKKEKERLKKEVEMQLEEEAKQESSSSSLELEQKKKEIVEKELKTEQRKKELTKKIGGVGAFFVNLAGEKTREAVLKKKEEEQLKKEEQELEKEKKFLKEQEALKGRKLELQRKKMEFTQKRLGKKEKKKKKSSKKPEEEEPKMVLEKGEGEELEKLEKEVEKESMQGETLHKIKEKVMPSIEDLRNRLFEIWDNIEIEDEKFQNKERNELQLETLAFKLAKTDALKKFSSFIVFESAKKRLLTDWWLFFGEMWRMFEAAVTEASLYPIYQFEKETQKRELLVKQKDTGYQQKLIAALIETADKFVTCRKLLSSALEESQSEALSVVGIPTKEEIVKETTKLQGTLTVKTLEFENLSRAIEAKKN